MMFVSKIQTPKGTYPRLSTTCLWIEDPESYVYFGHPGGLEWIFFLRLFLASLQKSVLGQVMNPQVCEFLGRWADDGSAVELV